MGLMNFAKGLFGGAPAASPKATPLPPGKPGTNTASLDAAQQMLAEKQKKKKEARMLALAAMGKGLMQTGAGDPMSAAPQVSLGNNQGAIQALLQQIMAMQAQRGRRY